MIEAREPTPEPGAIESDYIAAMSRAAVVRAYAGWSDLSSAERLCLEQFLPPTPRVLDLGCGTGRVAGFCVSLGGTYLGVDASAEMIAAARSTHADLSFEISDILSLELLSSSYDAVLMMHNVLDGLFPLARRRDALRLAHDVLSNDGMVVCSSHLRKTTQATGYHSENYHGATVSNYRSSLPEFVDEVESAGFEVSIAVRDYRNGVADWAYLVAKRAD